MKERGILFSDAMVRAILAGKKTQTRRAMKLEVPESVGSEPYFMYGKRGHSGPGWYVGDGEYLDEGSEHLGHCPYGVAGDRLWVREATLDDGGGEPGNLHYRSCATPADIASLKAAGHRWTPSLLMPRSRSRITLEITNVRVERAQAISDADIAAEGVDAEAVEALWSAAKVKRKVECGPVASIMSGGDELDIHDAPPKELWRLAWTLINGRESWEANPFVWVIEFKVVPR